MARTKRKVDHPKGTRVGEFRSKFEKTLATTLKQRKVKYGYENVSLEYTLTKNYIPDFELPNGILVEAKGVLAPADRRKMKAVVEQHPDRDIRFVFQRASNKLSKHSKTTYGQWATKANIKWADGKIPNEWLK